MKDERLLMRLIVFLLSVFIIFSSCSDDIDSTMDTAHYYHEDKYAFYYHPETFQENLDQLLNERNKLYVLLKFSELPVPKINNDKYDLNGHSNHDHSDQRITININNQNFPKGYIFDKNTILTSIDRDFDANRLINLMSVGLVKSEIKIDAKLKTTDLNTLNGKVIIVEPYLREDRSTIERELNKKGIKFTRPNNATRSLLVKLRSKNELENISLINEVYFCHYPLYLDNFSESDLEDYVHLYCKGIDSYYGYKLAYSPLENELLKNNVTHSWHDFLALPSSRCIDIGYTPEKYGNQSGTPDISGDSEWTIIENAISKWFPHVKNINFTSSGNVDAVIRYDWTNILDNSYSGEFSAPSDGSASSLAKGYRPFNNLFNPYWVPGHIHFDDEYLWKTSFPGNSNINQQGVNLFSVAMHEFGHAIGFGHFNGFEPGGAPGSMIEVEGISVMNADYYLTAHFSDIKDHDKFYAEQSYPECEPLCSAPVINDCCCPSDMIYDSFNGYCYYNKPYNTDLYNVEISSPTPLTTNNVYVRLKRKSSCSSCSCPSGFSSTGNNGDCYKIFNKYEYTYNPTLLYSDTKIPFSSNLEVIKSPVVCE